PHPLRHGRIEGVEPVEFGKSAELEIDHRRHVQKLRRQRPGSGGVEAPADEAPPRVVGPGAEARGEALPGVMRPIEMRARGTAVDDVDAEREEALAAGGAQPRIAATIPLDAPARR